MKKALFGIFLLCVSTFLFHYFLVGQAVYGDGIFYWSVARSLAVDHNLTLGNELTHRYDHEANNAQKEPLFPAAILQKENVDFRLPIGVSLSFLPIFFLAGGIGLVLRLLGFGIALNGYSDIYQIFVGIENICFVLAGLFFVYKLLCTFYSQRVSFISTFFLFFASNLFYYSSIDVINSHPLIFLLSSIFLYFFFTVFSYSWYEWVILGCLAGFLALTRNQEVVFLTLPFMLLISLFKKAKMQLKKIFFSFLLLITGFVSVVSIQFFIWKYAYNDFFHNPYFSKNAFDFLHPHLLGLLINSRTGLLFTSPVVCIGCIGLLLLARRRQYIGIVGLVLFFLEYFLIASWSSWDQASSYGIRMLISTFPLVAVGLGEVISWTTKKYSFRFLLVVVLFFILFNFLMIVRFHLFIKNPTYDMGHVTRIEAQKKINTIFHTQFHFFY